MREMKDSGVEWIGKIPYTWGLSKIGALYRERNTKVSDTKYEPLSVTKQGIVPQLETAAKSDNGDSRKLIKRNDFVINSRSDRRGSCGISEYAGSCSLINIVLKPKNNMCNQYYDFVFHSELFADEFYRWGNGIVDDLWSTKWSNMKRIYIPVPSFAEQAKISSYLDSKCSKIDAIIAREQAVTDKLKEYKQILISEAIRHGIHGEELQLSRYFWIDSIPRSWKVGQLKYFATIRSGITMGKKYPNNSKLVDIPYLRVANVQGEYVNLSDIATISVLPEEVEKYCLKADELLMTEGGDRDKLGRGCVWKGEINPCLHQNHVFAVSTDNSRLLVHFLDYVTTSDIARSYFEYTAKKTTNLASTNSTTILQFRIPIPPVAEQQEIVDYLDTRCTKINQLIKGCKIIIDKLTEYKKSLIYEVVTGKKEV